MRPESDMKNIEDQPKNIQKNKIVILHGSKYHQKE